DAEAEEQPGDPERDSDHCRDGGAVDDLLQRRLALAAGAHEHLHHAGDDQDDAADDQEPGEQRRRVHCTPRRASWSYSAISRRVTGPGTPAPTGCPSMVAIGSTPRVALVRNASSAPRSSSGSMRRSRTVMPSPRASSSTLARVMPSRMPTSEP